MKLYLIRHGQTEGNKTRCFNGCRTDEPLTEEGKAGLKRIESVEENAMLYTSPMIRARETAAIMLPDLTATVADDLKEMDFGVFEGRNHRMLDGNPDYQAWLDSGGESRIPGGESNPEFAKRACRGFARVIKEAAESKAGAVYIVAHGGTIMAVMNFLTGENYYEFNVPNGAGYEIDLEVDDAGNVLAATAYDRFCGGLSDGSVAWRPPQYTPSGSMDG